MVESDFWEKFFYGQKCRKYAGNGRFCRFSLDFSLTFFVFSHQNINDIAFSVVRSFVCSFVCPSARPSVCSFILSLSGRSNQHVACSLVFFNFDLISNATFALSRIFCAPTLEVFGDLCASAPALSDCVLRRSSAKATRNPYWLRGRSKNRGSYIYSSFANTDGSGIGRQIVGICKSTHEHWAKLLLTYLHLSKASRRIL